MGRIFFNDIDKHRNYGSGIVFQETSMQPFSAANFLSLALFAKFAAF